MLSIVFDISVTNGCLIAKNFEWMHELHEYRVAYAEKEENCTYASSHIEANPPAAAAEGEGESE